MLTDYAKVRPGRPADASPLAAVFRESWLVAYQGIIPYAYLTAMIGRRGTEWWDSILSTSELPLVLEAGGTVAGYASYGRARGPLKYDGEIYELYLAPVYQGLGFGEQLFESARQRLAEKELHSLVVWALSDNLGACDFYHRRGGTPVAKASERFGTALVPKTAFAWS
ncbi:MAG: GNAT family N-acetyltransferase [Hyphomicrobiaceae bacterium]